jgi:uroporphyrinogen-III decarboxylase
MVVAGEFFSPLKMFHMTLGLADTTYFVVFHPEKAAELAAVHEAAQLELMREMLEGGVEVCMSMDNLDSMFHPPEHVELFSASYYEKASALCHRYGAKFFIHACGQQKANLPLISSLGVDGLEGVAYPPLGDVQLEEAFGLVHDRFILTGGVSAHETERLKTRDEIFDYTEDLFNRMQPFANRFVFSASCNTAINTPWETIKHFRDAWLEFGRQL